MGDVELTKKAKRIKYFLIFMNLVFFATGVILLAMAAWIIAFPYSLDILAILDNPLIERGVYILIAIGCFIVAVSSLGLFGACRESQCGLGLYFSLLLIIFVIQVIGASLIAAYRDEIDGFVRNSLEGTMDDYEGENATDTYSTAWNAMQVLLECCGTHNYTDWGSTTWGASSSEDYPLTCCVYDDPNKLLTGTDWPKPTNSSACLGDYGSPDSTVLNMGGCADALRNFLDDNIIFIDGLGLGFISIQISCFCMSVSLCYKIRKAENLV